MGGNFMSLHSLIKSSECTPNMIRNYVIIQPWGLHRKHYNGYTPLHVALLHSVRFELIHKLLQLGANVNSPDYFGYTPAHYAVGWLKRDMMFEVVQLLMKYGANFNLQNIIDETPVHYLIRRIESDVHLKVLRYLLRNGVCIDQESPKCKSYLVRIEFRSRESWLNLEVTKMLLEFGAKPNKDLNEYDFKFYTQDFNCQDLHVMKLLMQYILIYEFKTDINIDKSLIYSKPYDECMNINIFSRHQKKYYLELLSYRDALIKELIMMNDDKINESETLFSFISERCVCGLSSPKCDVPVLFEVLSRFHSQRYACCNDLFIASLKRDQLISIFGCIRIFVMKASSNSIENNYSNVKVVLTSDVNLILATYLSKNDILNLILTFWNPTEQNKMRMCLLDRVDKKPGFFHKNLKNHFRWFKPSFSVKPSNKK